MRSAIRAGCLSGGIGYRMRNGGRDLAAGFRSFLHDKFTGRGLGSGARFGNVRGHRGAIGFAATSAAGTTFTVYFPASQKQIPDVAQDPGRGESGEPAVRFLSLTMKWRSCGCQDPRECGLPSLQRIADGRRGVICLMPMRSTGPAGLDYAKMPGPWGFGNCAHPARCESDRSSGVRRAEAKAGGRKRPRWFQSKTISANLCSSIRCARSEIPDPPCSRAAEEEIGCKVKAVVGCQLSVVV